MIRTLIAMAIDLEPYSPKDNAANKLAVEPRIDGYR